MTSSMWRECVHQRELAVSTTLSEPLVTVNVNGVGARQELNSQIRELSGFGEK